MGRSCHGNRQYWNPEENAWAFASEGLMQSGKPVRMSSLQNLWTILVQ